MGIGMTVGLAGAWATTRYLSGFLYQVEPTDAFTYWVACAFFLLLALVAAWLPARRAARVDPIIALRAE